MRRTYASASDVDAKVCSPRRTLTASTGVRSASSRLVRCSMVGIPTEQPAGHTLVHGHTARGSRPRSSRCRAYQPTAPTAMPRMSSDRERPEQRCARRRRPCPRTRRAVAPGSARVGGRLVDHARRRAARWSRATSPRTGSSSVTLDDDDGDVVVAAGAVRRVDEAGRGARGIVARGAASRAMSSSCTMSVSPSEQSRTRSPGASSTGYTSTSTSASTPSARVMIERCGCTAASSAVSRPSRDELLDEAVVVGDLPELAVVQEVGARVADVADEEGPAASPASPR